MMLIEIGYDAKFVVSVKDAVTIAEILEKSHMWKESYVTGGDNTYNAWPMEKTISMQLVGEDLFRMAKLAGKPERK